ncbi:hypothetical protein MKEN_00761000 [Mycena kentingensis (nom. inval.)]|nr:hypothetical protein MKEN_00761000 [Mycena kentingensis (nom. inval.)]
MSSASPQALLVGLNVLGVLINTLLYGFVLGQFLTYFNNGSRKKDPVWIRTIVWSMFWLDTIHSIVEFYAVWDVTVTNYGNLASFGLVSWTIPFTATADACAAIMTQTFLLYRVYKLTKSNVLVGFLATVAVLGFAFGVTAGVYSGVLGRVDKFAPLVKWVILWLTFQSVSDVAISVSLIVALVRSRTGFRKTDTIINRLIIGAVETGVFAATFAMGDLFAFVFFQESNLYLLFAFPIGRIYTNTLLHVLNSRDSIRSAPQTMTGGAISLGEVFSDVRLSSLSALPPAAAAPSPHKNPLESQLQFNRHNEDRDHRMTDSDYKAHVMVDVEQSVHVR